MIKWLETKTEIMNIKLFQYIPHTIELNNSRYKNLISNNFSYSFSIKTNNCDDNTTFYSIENNRFYMNSQMFLIDNTINQSYENMVKIIDVVPFEIKEKVMKKHEFVGRCFRVNREDSDTTLIISHMIKLIVVYRNNTKTTIDLALCFNIKTNERVFLSLKNDLVKKMITENSIKYL